MIRCACGFEHTDETRVAQCGWQRLSAPGEFARVVQCRECTGHVVAEIIRDAAKCHACFRVVTGTSGDIHACIPNVGVMCARCAARDPRRKDWTEWKAGGPTTMMVCA